MQLKFKAINEAPEYTISGETINGLDLSVFPEGGKFVGDDTTRAAGIFDVERVDGVLYVTLAQSCAGYRVPVPSHDWTESGYIDAATFSNDVCYIIPTAAPAGTVTQKTADGWTVVKEVAE